MNTKKIELIKNLSGTKQYPDHVFPRWVSLDSFIDMLTQAREKYEYYDNLEVHIDDSCESITLSIHGERKLTPQEKYDQERIDVILRVKEKTSDGLTRDELLFENDMGTNALNHE